MNASNSQFEVNGTVISPGIIIGEACHYQTGSIEQTAVYKVTSDQVENELKRLEKAIILSKEEIVQLSINIEKILGSNEAKIFETHILLLEDKQLLGKIQSKVKEENVNIEYAVKVVFEEFEDIFAKMDDEYLKDRGTDFSELKRRVLSHLTGEKGRFLCRHECLANKKKGRIILTSELTPSMISLLENKNIDGFITKLGGKNSHAAILARAVGIPVISGINIIEKIKCETPIIIDGNSGKVLFNPPKETIDKYNKIIKKEKQKLAELEKAVGPIIKTNKGTELEIYANIINLYDMKFYNQLQLAGIGLVRTEFLFFDYKEFPTAEEQEILYSEIVKKANGHPVTFRLFDVGGDKKIPSLKFTEEENPLLGLRGIRYLMKYKKILTDQITAICNSAKHGIVKILYPMISNIDELKEVNEITKKIINDNDFSKDIKTGMMFEVPSVFIDPAPFLELIDFISIGSNDLVQYLYGVDRNNTNVSYLYKQDSDAIYKLINNVIEEANKEKKDVTLCGEIDFNSQFLKKIIKLGIRKFSISPVTTSKIIEKIKKMDL